MNSLPLVSIGLPTFNRAELLPRAVESILAQSYPNIELVISDNASQDETQTICERFVREDGRIKYIRQEVNKGPSSNFVEVLHQATGKYFMWLSDDDWLDHAYISECVAVLEKNPDYALVGGRAKSYKSGEFVGVDKPTNLEQESSVSRVLQYYAEVGDNGIFYGLMRRKQVLKNSIKNMVGGDWLFIAGMAYQGKVATLENVSVHRSQGGTSAGLLRIARTLGISPLQIVFRFLFIAWMAARDILYANMVYRDGGMLYRFGSALRVFGCIYISKSVVQNFKHVAVRLLKMFIGEERYCGLRDFLRRRAG